MVARPVNLPENDSPMNQAALERLKELKAEINETYLYVLNLAQEGLDLNVPGSWQVNRPALEEQVGELNHWPAADAQAWLTNNPEVVGHSPEDQERNLESLIQGAPTARSAAARVLNEIYSINRAHYPSETDLS